MRKIKRLIRKQILPKIKFLKYHVKVPAFLFVFVLITVIIFPMITALLLTANNGSSAALSWGSRWGGTIIHDKTAMKSTKKNIPACELSAPVVSVIQRNTGKVLSLDIEEYTAGVVAGEMPSSFPPEALKAQAVAARTYAVSKIIRGSAKGNSMDHPGAPLCDGPHCQVYKTPEELRKVKSAEWMETQWPIIKRAVMDTAGQIMYYDGSLVEQPLFHSASGGRTENSEDVFVSALPYLRSVESPYEDDAPHTGEAKTIPLSTFAEKSKKAYGSSSVNKANIKIISRSAGGRVEKVKIGDKIVSGRDVRDLFELRSANFTVSFSKGNPVFTTYGYGHGVGMSQWGACGMAGEGYDYIDILCHYYSGIELRLLD